MKSYDIKKVISKLVDKPVDEPSLLVNRHEAIDMLSKNIEYVGWGIYGICGYRGIGKTSVLNMISLEYPTITIHITEKESKETILLDFLYKLAHSVSDIPQMEKHSQEAMSFVTTEIVKHVSTRAGVSMGINADIEQTTVSEQRTPIYHIYEHIDRLIDKLLEIKGHIILTIDELDKEEKKDVSEILDSIKGTLKRENLLVIISLPAIIFSDFINDKLNPYQDSNLDNIIDDIVFLPPLTNEEIKEIIKRRMQQYEGFFAEKALEYIAIYSDGNPREAIWIARKIALENIEAKRITGKMSLNTIKAITSRYFNAIDIPDTYRDILRTVIEHSDKRQVIEKLKAKGLKASTISTYISRMKGKGLLREIDGKLYVPGKIRFII